MSKRARQYIGLVCAVLVYYIVHEGAHFVAALFMGVFKQVNFMGLGMQIDIFAENLTDTQLGIFCIVGSAATAVTAYVLTALTGYIGKRPSKLFKAVMYYVTIALLLLDPVYLSVLCGLFGGGDMNGIARLFPQTAARIGYGVLLLIHAALFLKVVLPGYKRAFAEE